MSGLPAVFARRARAALRLAWAALWLLAGMAAPALAQDGRSQRATWINPLDIDYKYNFEQINQRISYRTGADPVIVRHRDAYYLFLTLADGYWMSRDMLQWRFITPNRWPFDSEVAPAAISDGDKLYLMQSSMLPRPLLSSREPASGQWDFELRLMAPIPHAVDPNQDRPDLPAGSLPPGPWDPDLFRDDDGRWYLYWNSSNVYPIYGIEVDPAHDWAYVGEPQALIRLHPDVHGWERFGRDHRDEATAPFIEGAWMSKRGGKYYLQYGAPGTEYNVYANGVYVADSPLGPFEYAPNNPMSYKPGGFVTGAGHGSSFQDAYGNWWNTGTPWVGLNWNFERRVAMFPAGFDGRGQMFVSTRFGDFPHWAANGPIADPDDLFTGWMLLSYRKSASASSTLMDFSAQNLTDENPRTIWVAGENRAGETASVDLGAVQTIRAVQVNFADYQSGVYTDAPNIWTAFDVLASVDGETWSKVAEVSAQDHRDRPNAYLPLSEPTPARYIRYRHGHVGAAHLAISDIRVFGSAPGAPPQRPGAPLAVRQEDGRNARISWRPVAGAVGYNVRWGLAPGRLRQTYQVWADAGTQLDLRALSTGQDYWLAIEAFNETGVSRLSRVVRLRVR